MRNIFLIFEITFLVVALGFLIAVSDGIEDPRSEAMDDVVDQTGSPDTIHDGVSGEMVIESPIVAIDDDGNLDEGFEVDDDLDKEYDNLWLFQYDPVEVGYEQDIEVEAGMVLKMKTLAVKPPVFEIKNFLSHAECDHVMQLALNRGLHTSQVVPDRSFSEDDEIKEFFKDHDVDDDDLLDACELRKVLMLFPAAKSVEFTDDDVTELIKLKLDKNDDGVIDLGEFIDSDTPEMEDEIEHWLLTVGGVGENEAKRSQARVSDQAWLDQWTTEDQVLLRLQDRVVGLTLLPSAIIQTSENLQVVRYQPGGHYHAHYDSNALDDDNECAHTYGIEDDDDDRKIKHGDDFSRKRLCRIATVLYYLNDVDEGGETAFPVADNKSFTQETIEESPYDIYDLSKNCHKSNVVVPPEKGKAILWYNHYLDDETGWLGENRNYSLHGGCDVTRGTKWIANNWITVDDKAYRQILFHRRHYSEQSASMVSESVADAPMNGRAAADGTLDTDEEIQEFRSESFVRADEIPKTYVGVREGDDATDGNTMNDEKLQETIDATEDIPSPYEIERKNPEATDKIPNAGDEVREGAEAISNDEGYNSDDGNYLLDDSVGGVRKGNNNLNMRELEKDKTFQKSLDGSNEKIRDNSEKDESIPIERQKIHSNDEL